MLTSILAVLVILSLPALALWACAKRSGEMARREEADDGN